MAKCPTGFDFSSLEQISSKDKTTAFESDQQPNVEIDFLVSTTNLGEKLIKESLDSLQGEILDIASDHNSIKLSALREDFKCNTAQAQELLIVKLRRFINKVSIVIDKLQESSLTQFNKHRYFLLYSCGIIEKLQQLLIIVGRPSELEEKLYLEEQRKPFISDESTTIHCLSLLWTSAIHTMFKFREPAHELFRQELEENSKSSIKKLDFFVAGQKHGTIFFMDLILMSWIQFNRLVKYEDLVDGIPLLCSCQVKLYFSTLEKLTTHTSPVSNILPQLLPLLCDIRHNYSAEARDLRHHSILPHEPCYSNNDVSELAYFIIWHLYSISENRPTSFSQESISCCAEVIANHLSLALQQFIPTFETRQMASPFQLSPHQEERFKLIFLMLYRWFEKNPQKTNVKILSKLFWFISENWSLFGKEYFDESRFRIDGLTVFQLCTAILNDFDLIYTTDGQAAASRPENHVKTEDEKQLLSLWDSLMTKKNPPPPKPPAQEKEKSSAIE